MACCWRAKGKERLPYPDGLERNAEACNIDKPHPTPNEKALANPRTRDAEVARLWQGENSGARPACKSPHGAFDMTGNVDEWVVNESGHPSTRRPRSCARHTLHISGAAGAGSAKSYVSLHISGAAGAGSAKSYVSLHISAQPSPRVWRKMCRDTYYFRVGAPPAAAAAAAAESADVG